MNNEPAATYSDIVSDGGMDPRKSITATPDEAEMRAEFERQHAGRNLTKHSLRGTYVSATIAALWNQHKRTAAWVASRCK